MSSRPRPGPAGGAPVIALLTDFGLDDPYTASMKGAILSVAPGASIVDISHRVPPQHIDEAAFLLWSVCRSFPPQTIFVCVVDPGVGTSRNILCARSGLSHFLAPDNGVLKFVMSSMRLRPIISVTNRRYFRPTVSRTFHGRDIFAPVAAHLAMGVPMERLGPRCSPAFGAERFLRLPGRKQFSLAGKIVHIDHFGNIVTNVLVKRAIGTVSLKVAGYEITSRASAYAKAGRGRPFMIVGSTNLLEISMRNASAAASLGVVAGQTILLQGNG